MKRIISLFLLFSILISSVNVYATFDEKNLPEFSPIKKFGRGSWSAETHNGDICYDRYGNPLLCFGTQGGFFWVVDLLTGKVKEKFDHIGGAYTNAQMVSTAPDGKVYMYFYGANTFNVYDPIANTYVEVTPDIRWRAQDGGCITEDGLIYMGTYDTDLGGSIYEFDTKTQKIKQYGPYDVNMKYIKGIATQGKYIYFGYCGEAENVRMVRLDKETGEQVEFLRNPGGGAIYNAYIVNNKLIANTYGALHIVDLDTLQPENKLNTQHAKTAEIQPSPYDKRVFYHYYADSIFQYNTETKVHKKVADCSLPVTLTWAELVNGEWVLALRSAQMGQIGYFDPNTNSVTTFNVDKLADAGPKVQCLAVSPEGILYVGGYQTSMGAYNINTKEFVYSLPLWKQNESTGFYKGKVYFGVYTDAVMYRYDPEKPMTDDYIGYNYNNIYFGYNANPSMIYDIEDEQDRIWNIEGYRDKLYLGTMSGYDKSGGALVILGEEDGVNPPSAEVYRNIIPDQTICGLAFKGDYLYLSSTARNGNGIYGYPDVRPQIAVFDINKKEVIKRVTPDFPVVGDKAKTIGDLSFGPDGLLWGSIELEGLIFAMDPETFEIKKYTCLNPGYVSVPNSRGYEMQWGDDGLLYTTSGYKLCVVDPETLQFNCYNNSCSLMTLDHNGNIWYANGGTISYREINQFDRLALFLKTLENLKKDDYSEEEWAELQNAIEKAKGITEDTDWDEIKYTIREIKGLRDKEPFVKPQNDIDIIVNGEKMEFDYDLTGTVKLYNGNAYVPYRAFLEALGYDADWNVHTGVIDAKRLCNNIVMTVNSNTYYFNNKEVTADISPVLLSGRQYIPLRIVAENIGYEVKWNEKENCVELIKNIKE